MSPLQPGAWRIVWKRARHDWVVVAAAFVTVVLATTLLASGPVYADAVAQSGLQRTLEDAPVQDVTPAVSATHDPLLLHVADVVVELSDGRLVGP